MFDYCKRKPMVVIAIATAIAGLLGFIFGSAYNQGAKDQKVEQLSTEQGILRSETAEKVKEIDRKVDNLGEIAVVNAANITVLQRGQESQQKGQEATQRDVKDIRDVVYKYLVPRRLSDSQPYTFGKE